MRLTFVQGRSPYDDVVEWGREPDGDAPETTQQFDTRGRPINLETRRINRDIIRSHNEVMLVIGVAEPENPAPAPEAQSEMRRDQYEDNIGLTLASLASRCIENAGVFGVNGLRERILVRPAHHFCTFVHLHNHYRSTNGIRISAFGSCTRRQGGTLVFLVIFSQESLLAFYQIMSNAKLQLSGRIEWIEFLRVSCKS